MPTFTQLPRGVIGNTRDFGSFILGSSPSGVAFTVGFLPTFFFLRLDVFDPCAANGRQSSEPSGIHLLRDITSVAQTYIASPRTNPSGVFPRRIDATSLCIYASPVLDALHLVHHSLILLFGFLRFSHVLLDSLFVHPMDPLLVLIGRISPVVDLKTL